jgi:hypothetical protein
MRPVLLVLALLFPLACADKSEDEAGAEGCEACATDEVCVAHLSDEETTERCEPLPADCGGVGSCDDQPCIGAIYDLCDEGWIGVGCSPSAFDDQAVILSCNPDSVD